MRPNTSAAPAVAAQANCGIVTDLASARESLSGVHAKGYAGGSEPEAPKREEPVEEYRDERVPPPRAGRPPVEEYRDEAPREPRRERMPEARVEEFRDEAVVEPHREHNDAGPRTPPVEDFRDEAVREPRREEREPRPERREPRREQMESPRERPREHHRGRGGADAEQRKPHIALKPDPANDAAPRRLRTETVAEPGAQDYAPSRAQRTPHKTIPIDRREHARERDSASKPVKAHATIDVSGRSKREEKAKNNGGIMGFLKRALGFGAKPAEATEKEETAPAPSSGHRQASHSAGSRDGRRDEHREQSRDGRRESGRDGERGRARSEGDGGGRRRHRRRGGRGRNSGGGDYPEQGHRNHGDI